MFLPEKLHNELQFQTARSGGKGGQNVNKVESKVELRFTIPSSLALTQEEKETLLQKLANRITSEGVLVLYHQTERSQLANKEKVIAKFDRLIRAALTPEKPRKATRPTLASLLEKRNDKTKRARVKAARKKPDWD